MRSPLVSSLGDDDAEADSDGEAPIPLRRRQSARTINAVAIDWSGAEANRTALEQSGFEIERIYSAGGNHSVAADRALAEQAASHKTEAVVLVVRSWEPPMMDFVDFLGEVRAQMEPGTIRVVLLLPIPGQNSVRPEHIEGWEAVLYDNEDTFLYVEALA